MLRYMYFMAIGNIWQTFGIFYDHLLHFVSTWYIFFRFWYHVPRKIWQPCFLHTWAQNLLWENPPAVRNRNCNCNFFTSFLCLIEFFKQQTKFSIKNVTYFVFRYICMYIHMQQLGTIRNKKNQNYCNSLQAKKMSIAMHDWTWYLVLTYCLYLHR
jgi:hypothetical protein